MSNTDAQESNGSGKHRGDAAPSEEQASSASQPHGRHRRDDGQ